MIIEIPCRLHLVYEDNEYELLEGTLVNDNYFKYEDKFGRKWKLKPVTNENIKFPFIIEPIMDEVKK